MYSVKLCLDYDNIIIYDVAILKKSSQAYNSDSVIGLITHNSSAGVLRTV